MRDRALKNAHMCNRLYYRVNFQLFQLSTSRNGKVKKVGFCLLFSRFGCTFYDACWLFWNELRTKHVVPFSGAIFHFIPAKTHKRARAFLVPIDSLGNDRADLPKASIAAASS